MHLVLDDVMTAAEAIFHQLSASQDKLPTHICEYLNLGEIASQSEWMLSFLNSLHVIEN